MGRWWRGNGAIAPDLESSGSIRAPWSPDPGATAMRTTRLAPSGLLVLLALLIDVTPPRAGSAAGGARFDAPVPPRALGGGAGIATIPVRTDGSRRVPISLGGIPDKQVNEDPGNLTDEAGPAIAVAPSGAIAIVWNGDETQKSIWFSRSLDGGTTFTPAVRINDLVAYPPSYSVYQADVAVGSDGTIYVVWFDYRAWADDGSFTSPIEVYLDRSSDGGATWGADVLVSTNGSGTYPWHFQPYLASDPTNGNLYVSFNDFDRYSPEGDPGDVSVARSLNAGASFEAKVRVDDLGAAPLPAQSFSSIAVDPASGDVYVAFEDSRGSSPDIYLARSSDAAQTFGANLRVNADTTSLQLQPSIRVDGVGRVCAVWFDWRTDPDPPTPPNLNHILFARSPAGGAAFGPAVQVNDVSMNADPGFSFPPRLAIDPVGAIGIAWFDRRADTTFCWFDRSNDGGLTFGPDLLLHENRDDLTHALPRIAFGAGTPVATWQDRRNGNGRFDVFFTRQSAVTDVAQDRAISVPALSSLPNPFHRETRVLLTLARPGMGRVDVRDVAGRRVRTLLTGPLAAGAQAVAWDGADDAGEPLPSGVYFIHVRAGAETMLHKVVLFR